LAGSDTSSSSAAPHSCRRRTSNPSKHWQRYGDTRMAETTTEVRADIEQTRARMSGAIAELERKVDVAQRVREHPWTAVGLALGAGVALSASRTDVRAAKVTADPTRETGTKLGSALDGVVAAL